MCVTYKTSGPTGGLAELVGFTIPRKYTNTHTESPQPKILSGICEHHSVFLTGHSFSCSEPPISSTRGFMRVVVGSTSSRQHNKISVGASRALLQSRHPLNQGITVMQLLDNSVSFYVLLSHSFRLNISRSDVIKIDLDAACAGFSFLCILD